MAPRTGEQSERIAANYVDLALDRAGIGTWEWDAVEDRVSWSSNFEVLHGFEPGTLGRSLPAYLEQVHPDDRRRVRDALYECAEGGVDYNVEYRLVTPQGVIRFVSGHGCRVPEGEGRGVRLIGFCRDVTSRVELLERERRARANAERSELYYRTLAETIPQQVWTASPAGLLDFVNQRAVDYFGLPSEEIVGSGWQQLVEPGDLRAMGEQWKRSLSTGEEYEVEFRLRRRDGRYRWHLGRAVPVRDEAGEIVHWLGTNTDVDEKKRLHGVMATQLEVAQLLINASSLETVAEPILESLCRNLDWSCAQLWLVDRSAEALHRTGGWCGPHMRAEDFEELSRGDHMSRGDGLPGNVLEMRQPVWIERLDLDFRCSRSDLVSRIGLRSAFGFPLLVSGEVAAVLEFFSFEGRPYDEPTVAAALPIGTQIGEFIQRVAAQNELSATVEQLRRLQELTDVALSHLSLSDLLDNLLKRISLAASADIAVVLLLDEERNDLHPVATVGGSLPDGLRIRVGESISGRAAAERKTVIARHFVEMPGIQPELRKLGFQSVMAVPLLVGDQLSGVLVGVLVVACTVDRPFTPAEIGIVELIAGRLAQAIEKSSLYEDARASNRAKDRFLSMASHELKTPLTVILGWTGILKRESDANLRRQAVEAIERSAQNQARVIEDFLDLTRIREGKLLLRMERVDLTDVVQRSVASMETLAAKRGVILELHRGDAALPLTGDPSRLEQVIGNLLSNAIKFTPRGKRVRVEVGADGAWARVAVTDEGVGITPQFLPKIFGVFEQDEAGQQAGGLGLGLHIVSTIVKMHGGTIEAKSEGAGKGATFIVRLPVS